MVALLHWVFAHARRVQVRLLDTNLGIIDAPAQFRTEHTASHVVPVLVQTIGIDVAGELLRTCIERVEHGDDRCWSGTLEGVGKVQPLIQEMIKELARSRMGIAWSCSSVGRPGSLPDCLATTSRIGAARQAPEFLRLSPTLHRS